MRIEAREPKSPRRVESSMREARAAEDVLAAKGGDDDEAQEAELDQRGSSGASRGRSGTTGA